MKVTAIVEKGNDGFYSIYKDSHLPPPNLQFSGSSQFCDKKNRIVSGDSLESYR